MSSDTVPTQQVKRKDVREHQSVKLHTTIRFALPFSHCRFFSVTLTNGIAAAQKWRHRPININQTPTVSSKPKIYRGVFPSIYFLSNNFFPFLILQITYRITRIIPL